MKKIIGLVILITMAIACTNTSNENDRTGEITSASGQVCVDCHLDVTPNIVSDWQLSKHSQNDVDCSVCHGDQHTSDQDVEKVEIPTPETCKACHEEQVEQFSKGKHALAWVAMKAMPTTHQLPMALTEGLKGCGGGHKIG